MVCTFSSGSHAAFQRLYEGPIGVARQPGATSEDKEIGTARAEEVMGCVHVCISYLVFTVACLY